MYGKLKFSFFVLFVVLFAQQYNCEEDCNTNDSDNLNVNLEHEVIQNDQLSEKNEENFVAVHVAALGNVEELDSSQPQLRNIVQQFIPANYNLVNVINATRELVLGVKYTIVFSFTGDEEDENKICSILVLEKPWLVKDSKKYKSLIANNCELPEVPQIPETEYSINPIFQRNNTEATSSEMKELESQILTRVVTSTVATLNAEPTHVNVLEDTAIETTTPSEDLPANTMKASSKNMLDDIFNLKNYYHTIDDDVGTSTTQDPLSSFSMDALDNLFGFKKETSENHSNIEETPIKKETNAESFASKTDQQKDAMLHELELEIKKIFSDLFQNDPDFQAAITALINEKDSNILQEKYTYIFNVIMSNLKEKIEKVSSRKPADIQEPDVDNSSKSNSREKRSLNKEDVLELANTALNELDHYDENDNKRILNKVLNVKMTNTKNATNFFITVSVANSECHENMTAENCAMASDNNSSHICVFEIVKQGESVRLKKSQCSSSRVKRGDGYTNDRPLAGGVRNTETNDETIVFLLNESLKGINAGESTPYELVEIRKASKQVVAGYKYKINAEFKTSENPSILCDLDILERAWIDNGRQVDIKCDNEKLFNFTQQPAGRSKRDVLVGTPVETKTDDEHVNGLLTKHLSRLSTGSDGKLELVKIDSIQRQVVTGILFKVKGDFKLNEKTMKCKLNVWERTWLKDDNEVNIEAKCDDQKFTTSRSKRSISHKNHSQYHNRDRDEQISALVKHEKAEKLFQNFIKKHSRKYVSKYEHNLRFKIFKKNLHKIEQLNKHETGTAKYGITHFADLTSKEYLHRTGLVPREKHENELGNPTAVIPDIEVPESFDWRDKGAVTSVKNQGNCGSCWAFSVTGNIEGLHAVKTGNLESYSEQELLDCDTVDNACNGGLPDDAYKAIENIGGLESENDYPYKAKKQQCSFSKNMSKVKVKGAVDLPKDEVAIQKYLVANGPISIGINANAMQFYRGGISHPWKILCRHSSLDHGVLIVGYGKKEYPMFNKTLPYWTIKNSWGPSWGEQGYYRIYRGDNSCGVAEMASSAILE